VDAAQNQDDLQARIVATLEPLVRQALADFSLPGLALGIVKHDALVYAQGFGMRNVETQEPVTPQSLFHMASISKPFVATAIMQLAEAGKLRLDAPVSSYLPYFRLAGDGWQQITLRQMLAHTAGMPDCDDYGWYRPEDDEAALERYVRSLAGEELIAAPGERHEYSNAAFEVLGDVVAKASGQSFESYLKTHVLDPLGMRNSTFLRSEVAPELATTPHFGIPAAVLPGVYPYHRAHAASSTLHSSVLEMSRWARANLRRGSPDEQRILQPASYAELWHPHVTTGEEIWEEAAGLGWFLGTYRGRRVVHHGGSDPGFQTDLVLLPDDDMAIVVLANANMAPLGSITDATLDLLLGLEPQAPKPPISMPLAATLAAEGLDAAVAQYQRLAAEPDVYDARPWRFADAVWGAIEVHRPDAVWPLLELWVAVQPDESLAHEMLGWAYLVDGDERRAADSLRRAVALDDENKHAAQLLRRLSA